MLPLAAVNAFILKRQKDVMVVGELDERQERKYSNGEINRELTTLKRILNLTRQNDKLMHVPHLPMLKERNVRTGFFEREQSERILAHLPPAIRPAVRFAYITGWRIPSEDLKLQWRHVDFEARVVRLDPHTPKNDEGRTFPFTDALERLCPGRIPHDLRRTAVRNLVRAGGHAKFRRSRAACRISISTFCRADQRCEPEMVWLRSIQTAQRFRHQGQWQRTSSPALKPAGRVPMQVDYSRTSSCQSSAGSACSCSASR